MKNSGLNVESSTSFGNGVKESEESSKVCLFYFFVTRSRVANGGFSSCFKVIFSLSFHLIIGKAHLYFRKTWLRILIREKSGIEQTFLITNILAQVE